MRTIERTCCICRSKADKRELLRLVVIGGQLAVDDSQRLPGRGAYIHPSAACLSRMGDSKRWERALRVESPGFEKAQVSRLAMELMRRFSGCEAESAQPERGGGRSRRGIRL